MYFHVIGNMKCQNSKRCLLLGFSLMLLLLIWFWIKKSPQLFFHTIYSPYYLPCPDIFGVKLHYKETEPHLPFPQLLYPQPKSLQPLRSDVLTVTSWLAPIVWEGTFNSDMLDSIYKPLNLTIGVTLFAMGKYTLFVRQFFDSSEKHFMTGYQVKYYIFTDNPKDIPPLRLGPGRTHHVIFKKKYKHWQEISMRRMEMISEHIRETAHREVDYLFCLDIDMVFYNSWGPEALGEMVATIHPGYYYVDRSSFPYERRSSSTAYISGDEGDFYYAGAIFGGRVKNVYEFTLACHIAILADKANGLMAAWQEESHLNRRFLSHKPSKLLSPEYLWNDGKPKPPELKLIRCATLVKNFKAVRD